MEHPLLATHANRGIAVTSMAMIDWRTAMLLFLVLPAMAVPAAPVPAPHAVRHLPRLHSVDGRVTAVRRLSREVTIRTPAGGLHEVTIARDAKVQARGMASMNAVRAGVVVHLEAVEEHNGKLVARSVRVR